MKLTGSNRNTGVELVPVPLCPPQRQPPKQAKKPADVPSQHDVAACLCLLVGSAAFPDRRSFTVFLSPSKTGFIFELRDLVKLQVLIMHHRTLRQQHDAAGDCPNFESWGFIFPTSPTWRLCDPVIWG
jgi:hypothetical protein